MVTSVAAAVLLPADIPAPRPLADGERPASLIDTCVRAVLANGPVRHLLSDPQAPLHAGRSRVQWVLVHLDVLARLSRKAGDLAQFPAPLMIDACALRPAAAPESAHARPELIVATASHAGRHHANAAAAADQALRRLHPGSLHPYRPVVVLSGHQAGPLKSTRHLADGRAWSLTTEQLIWTELHDHVAALRAACRSGAAGAFDQALRQLASAVRRSERAGGLGRSDRLPVRPRMEHALWSLTHVLTDIDNARQAGLAPDSALPLVLYAMRGIGKDLLPLPVELDRGLPTPAEAEATPAARDGESVTIAVSGQEDPIRWQLQAGLAVPLAPQLEAECGLRGLIDTLLARLAPLQSQEELQAMLASTRQAWRTNIQANRLLTAARPAYQAAWRIFNLGVSEQVAALKLGQPASECRPRLQALADRLTSAIRAHDARTWLELLPRQADTLAQSLLFLHYRHISGGQGLLPAAEVNVWNDLEAALAQLETAAQERSSGFAGDLAAFVDVDRYGTLSYWPEERHYVSKGTGAAILKLCELGAHVRDAVAAGIPHVDACAILRRYVDAARQAVNPGGRPADMCAVGDRVVGTTVILASEPGAASQWYVAWHRELPTPDEAAAEAARWQAVVAAVDRMDVIADADALRAHLEAMAEDLSAYPSADHGCRYVVERALHVAVRLTIQENLLAFQAGVRSIGQVKANVADIVSQARQAVAEHDERARAADS